MIASVLQSCGTIYYATFSIDSDKLTLLKSEFWEVKKEKKTKRNFVLLTVKDSEFPICVYKTNNDTYIASLLKCTHRGCELNVGGGIYTCPCHGSEFSTTGKVLEGPADQDLLTFHTETDHENIYISLS